MACDPAVAAAAASTSKASFAAAVCCICRPMRVQAHGRRSTSMTPGETPASTASATDHNKDIQGESKSINDNYGSLKVNESARQPPEGNTPISMRHSAPPLPPTAPDTLAALTHPGQGKRWEQQPDDSGSLVWLRHPLVALVAIGAMSQLTGASVEPWGASAALSPAVSPSRGSPGRMQGASLAADRSHGNH